MILTFRAGQEEETIPFDCNQDLGRGKRTLHIAAGTGQEAACRVLLELGADVKAVSAPWTPLAWKMMLN